MKDGLILLLFATTVALAFYPRRCRCCCCSRRHQPKQWDAFTQTDAVELDPDLILAEADELWQPTVVVMPTTPSVWARLDPASWWKNRIP